MPSLSGTSWKRSHPARRPLPPVHEHSRKPASVLGRGEGSSPGVQWWRTSLAPLVENGVAGSLETPMRRWGNLLGRRGRGGFRVGGVGGGRGIHFALAHGHGVYEAEELFGGDGLRRAELLAAVPADEDGGEGAVLYPEPASGGGGFIDAVLEEGFRQEVAVLAAGLPASEEVELAGVGLVVCGGGEDEEAARVWGAVSAQDCSLARSSVLWAAAA